jgi:hypothetical protein
VSIRLTGQRQVHFTDYKFLPSCQRSCPPFINLFLWYSCQASCQATRSRAVSLLVKLSSFVFTVRLFSFTICDLLVKLSSLVFAAWLSSFAMCNLLVKLSSFVFPCMAIFFRNVPSSCPVVSVVSTVYFCQLVVCHPLVCMSVEPLVRWWWAK